MGVEVSGTVEEAAGLLVAGTLAPRTRFAYGWELGAVARWCDEHGLGLLDLSPLDVAALVVARRSDGQCTKNLMSSLAYVYRNKPGGPEEIAGLARWVDKVWRAKNREKRPPTRRAPVLPLQCWMKMRDAVGSEGYPEKLGWLLNERVARDRLIISLGLSAGLRPGEIGRLSASNGHIEEAKRLVLPLVAGGVDATTKTGLSEIVVPLGVPPFDALPLADDFERLRELRLARPGGDDYLVAPAWHYASRGGLTVQSVTDILRKAARCAGVSGADRIVGHSLRRSMIHIATAGGWSLEQIAAVTGHVSTTVIERTYLEGYGGVWARSDEGRQVLLGASDGWEDSPANVSAGFGGAARGVRRWWEGRDLQADRAEATALARSTPRVSVKAVAGIDRMGRKWEAFCERRELDQAKPSKALLEMLAIDLAGDSGANRFSEVLYLTDHFAATPTTPLADIPQIRKWVYNAYLVGERTAAANRRKSGGIRRSREIVPVSDEAMERLFTQPLINRHEGVRLMGLIWEQGRTEALMTAKQRQEFRFGAHARINGDSAELFSPFPGDGPPPPGRRPAVTVERSGGDPLWCGHEAVTQLIANYPNLNLKARYLPDPPTSHCTPLIRWLQARAAVAVLYATGLRPTDLDGIRWPDLRIGDDGAIMWRLPYSKGNLLGDRVQVLRLESSDRPWCPVTALKRLAASIQKAHEAGWEERATVAESGGTLPKVFGPRAGRSTCLYLIEPAGVNIRPQDFRYRMAAKLWAETQDIQIVRSTLFHRSEAVSMGYINRGLPARTRAQIDTMAGSYDKAGR